jgi:hypothetical protein
MAAHIGKSIFKLNELNNDAESPSVWIRPAPIKIPAAKQLPTLSNNLLLFDRIEIEAQAPKIPIRKMSTPANTLNIILFSSNIIKVTAY